MKYNDEHFSKKKEDELVEMISNRCCNEKQAKGLVDPLFLNGFSSDIFAYKDYPQEEIHEPLELENDTASENDPFKVGHENAGTQSALDHSRISAFLDGIEKMLSDPGPLQTILSTPRSSSIGVSESISNATETVGPVDQETKYKVSTLKNTYAYLQPVRGQREPPNPGRYTAELRQQLLAIKAEDQERYSPIEQHIREKMKVGDWSGKFLPQERTVLEKLFLGPLERQIASESKPATRTKVRVHRIPKPLPRPPTSESEESEVTDVTIPAKKVPWQKFRLKYTKSSQLSERTREIFAASLLKQKQKQNTNLEIIQQKGCYTTNPDRFEQKRFRMNPRFTWLCKTNTNPYLDWSEAIKNDLDLARGNNFERRPSKIRAKLLAPYAELNEEYFRPSSEQTFEMPLEQQCCPEQMYTQPTVLDYGNIAPCPEPKPLKPFAGHLRQRHLVKSKHHGFQTAKKEINLDCKKNTKLGQWTSFYITPQEQILQKVVPKKTSNSPTRTPSLLRPNQKYNKHITKLPKPASLAFQEEFAHLTTGGKTSNSFHTHLFRKTCSPLVPRNVSKQSRLLHSNNPIFNLQASHGLRRKVQAYSGRIDDSNFDDLSNLHVFS